MLMPFTPVTPTPPSSLHISLSHIDGRPPSPMHMHKAKKHTRDLSIAAYLSSCSANSFSSEKQLSAINPHLFFKGLECWDSQLYKCVCRLWWVQASHLAALFKTPIDGRPLCQDEDISLSMRCKLCHNATVGFRRTLKGKDGATQGCFAHNIPPPWGNGYEAVMAL